MKITVAKPRTTTHKVDITVPERELIRDIF